MKNQNILPAIKPAPTNVWDPRLILDLAIGVENEETLLERYNITKDDFVIFMNSPTFKRDLSEAIRTVREDGLSFRSKVKVQAEGYLEILDDLIYDKDTPAGVRLDAIKSTVKWAGLEPKDETENVSGNAVNIQINF